MRFKNKKGFTLIEMLIAMAIFVSFTAVLIGSYTSIVKAQREANEYRIMYSEARKVFETLIQEFRGGMIDYRDSLNLAGGDVSNDRQLFFISKDGNRQTEILYQKYDEALAGSGKVSLKYSNLQNVTNIDGKLDPTYDLANSENIDLNDPSRVQVKEFKIYATPMVDPYGEMNVDNNGVQFQPRVTIYANFVRKMSSGKTFDMDLQTSVSSRVYNQIVPNIDTKKEE